VSEIPHPGRSVPFWEAGNDEIPPCSGITGGAFGGLGLVAGEIAHEKLFGETPDRLVTSNVSLEVVSLQAGWRGWVLSTARPLQRQPFPQASETFTTVRHMD
jgi:hypothetical protein